MTTTTQRETVSPRGSSRGGDRAAIPLESPELIRRPNRIRRGVRRGLHRVLRSPAARRWMQFLGWHRTVDRAGITSTSQAVALWPALAATRPRIVGPLMGEDRLTHFPVTHSVQGLYRSGAISSTNVVIAGAIGVAKSGLTKTQYVFRAVSCDNNRAVVFDRKKQQDAELLQGEYRRVASVTNAESVIVSRDPRSGTRINILDPMIAMTTGEGGGTVGQDYLLTMVAETAKGASLSVEERYALSKAHTEATTRAGAENRQPILSDVVQALYSPQPSAIPGPRNEAGMAVLDERGVVGVDRLTEWGLTLALALERYLTDGDLSGLLDGESRGPDGKPPRLDARLVVIDTSALPEGSTALSLMMAIFATYLTNRWATTSGFKTLILEEAYSATNLTAVPLVLRELVKRARGVGASVVSVFHHLSDIPLDSPMRSIIQEAQVAHIFGQDQPDDARDLVKTFNLPDDLVETVQSLPKGVHIYVRGKLPTTIVQGFRTPLEVWFTDTDEMMRGDDNV